MISRYSDGLSVSFGLVADTLYLDCRLHEVTAQSRLGLGRKTGERPLRWDRSRRGRTRRRSADRRDNASGQSGASTAVHSRRNSIVGARPVRFPFDGDGMPAGGAARGPSNTLNIFPMNPSGVQLASPIKPPGFVTRSSSGRPFFGPRRKHDSVHAHHAIETRSPDTATPRRRLRCIQWVIPRSAPVHAPEQSGSMRCPRRR